MLDHGEINGTNLSQEHLIFPKEKCRMAYNHTAFFDILGEPCRDRTCDPLIKSQMLYQLS